MVGAMPGLLTANQPWSARRWLDRHGPATLAWRVDQTAPAPEHAPAERSVSEQCQECESTGRNCLAHRGPYQGDVERVHPDRIRVGDTIRARPEQDPTDGLVTGVVDGPEDRVTFRYQYPDGKHGQYVTHRGGRVPRVLHRVPAGLLHPGDVVRVRVGLCSGLEMTVDRLDMEGHGNAHLSLSRPGEPDADPSVELLHLDPAELVTVLRHDAGPEAGEGR